MDCITLQARLFFFILSSLLCWIYSPERNCLVRALLLNGDNLRRSSVWNREVSLTPYDVKLSECCRRAEVPGENLSVAVVSRNAL